MTPDALNQGNALLKQVNDAQNLKNKHLAQVKNSFHELSAEQQAALSTTLCSVHDAVITALQTQLTNLPGTYTAPAQTPKP
jgi:uncharacterized protein with beta-barrel porin domain